MGSNFIFAKSAFKILPVYINKNAASPKIMPASIVQLKEPIVILGIISIE